MPFAVSCASTLPAAPPRWNHEWARGAVFYEVFVRSFADANGDGIGDIDGLIAKLDYLNDGNPATKSDLGIDALWLMPMFQSPSYHGYDTTDYETIERDYGTNADFQRLLHEAHKRGIRVIIDFVMNHTSSEHPWFIDSASSPSSSKRDWYVWSVTNPGWTQPWGGDDPTWHLRNGAYYYGAFWSGMPDLNYRTPAVKAEMFRLARYWLQQGVDGFRLDATRYLVEDGAGAGQADTPETHAVLKELATEVMSVRPDAVLVAENTVDTAKLATYYADMPMNFNFPLSKAILKAVDSSDSTPIRSTLREMIALYPHGVIDMPFLTNHDHVRVATQFHNDEGRLRNAAAILLTLPGAPFVYYGEEVGLQNGPGSQDEWKRTPMPWTPAGGFTTATPWFGYAPGTSTNNVALESNDPRSLLSYYRNWIAARKSSDGLSRGDITIIETPPAALAFVRTAAKERVLVVHNLSDAPAVFPLPVRATGFETLHADIGVAGPAGGVGSWQLAMPARTSGAWRVR